MISYYHRQPLVPYPNGHWFIREKAKRPEALSEGKGKPPRKILPKFMTKKNNPTADTDHFEMQSTGKEEEEEEEEWCCDVFVIQR